MPTSLFHSDPHRRTTLFDSTVIREAQEGMEFMANVLEASTEYSIIGKDIEGKILLWNEGVRRMYGYEPDEVVEQAHSAILHTPEDIALGDFLQGYIRGGDIACRYGGEEFTLILPETPLTVLQQRAEQVCTDAWRLVVQHRHETLGPITLSLGLAVCPEHGTTADVLLRAADAALYRAKATGRDRVVVAPAQTKEIYEDHTPGR